jgi:hypothetical protein
MLNPQEFARLEPNAREELISKFNLVRSGFGSDVRGGEVFMFDGFTKLDLINVNLNANDNKNTQQDGGGISTGNGIEEESISPKRNGKRKAVSIPSK